MERKDLVLQRRFKKGCAGRHEGQRGAWRGKVVKEDGSIAARNIVARLGKGELRTDAALREQVLDVLVVHRHLIPTARRGHYMMMVPHD